MQVCLIYPELCTLYRRLEKAGISGNDNTPLSNVELDGIVKYLLKDTKLVGIYVFHVKHYKIPDHKNVDARQASIIHHRVYTVPHPT